MRGISLLAPFFSSTLWCNEVTMRIIPIYPTYREANCYLAASDDGRALVFDPGDGAERICSIAKRNGLEITAIVLTHAHFDHIMATNELAELVGVPVYIHKGDLQALYEPSLNLSGLGAGIDYTLDRSTEVIALSEGDTVSVGGECFTVMLTPGHTPGSACFVCGDIIVTGDTLFAGTIGRTDFPGGDIGEMRRSLARLRGLSGDYTLYSGHGAETTLERERKHNFCLTDSFLNGDEDF